MGEGNGGMAMLGNSDWGGKEGAVMARQRTVNK